MHDLNVFKFVDIICNLFVRMNLKVPHVRAFTSDITKNISCRFQMTYRMLELYFVALIIDHNFYPILVHVFKLARLSSKRPSARPWLELSYG